MEDRSLFYTSIKAVDIDQISSGIKNIDGDPIYTSDKKTI